MRGHGGRIEFDNTLESRLNILEQEALPSMRKGLFG